MSPEDRIKELEAEVLRLRCEVEKEKRLKELFLSDIFETYKRLGKIK